MKRFLLIHYGEIGLKLGNKKYFVDKLRRDLKMKLEKRFGLVFKVVHVLSRFLVELPEDFVEDEYVEVLKRVFGVKNFQFVYEGGVDLEDLGEEIWSVMPDLGDISNFRVSCKRAMELELNSAEYERGLGAELLKKGIDLPVKLKGADLVVNVEFFNSKAYFSFNKYEGVAGLSATSCGKLLVLISSGIDSPVAAYEMMRRGARVVFVHFSGYPFTDQAESEQCETLVKHLSSYQFNTKFYIVPFGEIQKSIGTNLDVPGKIRTVLYRRMMLRIASELCRKNEAKGLVTGDNYGQVASQTPENMFVIDEAASVPVYRPLIAYDKEDIIARAKEIGTLDTSLLPCKDACTMFSPKSPELKANLYDTLEYEKGLPIDDWVQKAVESAEVKYF